MAVNKKKFTGINRLTEIFGYIKAKLDALSARINNLTASDVGALPDATVPVNKGGTGATTAAGAILNLFGANSGYRMKYVSEGDSVGNITAPMDGLAIWQESDESAGIILTGDGVYIFAPPDEDALIFINEDNNSKGWSIDGDGILKDSSGNEIYIRSGGTVSGVKGNVESSYRTGNVNLTPENIGTFKVIRGDGVSTQTTNYWAAMCHSTIAGAILPTAGRWYHVLSMDWMGNSPTNWISQLAIATQEGKDGVWWRTNDNGDTNIDSSTWHRLAEGDNNGNANRANLLQYSHGNEINFLGKNYNNVCFNWRDADTDAANAVSDMHYYFCNYSDYYNGTTIHAGRFAGSADRLGEYSPDENANGNTIVKRTADGYVKASYFNQSSGVEDWFADSHRIVWESGDGYLRKASVSRLKDIILGWTRRGSWLWGASQTLTISTSGIHEIMVQTQYESYGETCYDNDIVPAFPSGGSEWIFNKAHVASRIRSGNGPIPMVTISVSGSNYVFTSAGSGHLDDIDGFCVYTR